MFLRPWLLASTMLVLCACSTVQETANKVADSVQEHEDKKERQVTVSTDNRSPTPNDPYYAPVEPQRPGVAVIPTGSLYNSQTAHSLYSFTPRYQIGDTVIIDLQENASAQKSAQSNIQKDTTYDLQPVQAPGGPLTINGRVVQMAIDQSTDFKGDTDSDQSHSLSGRITVSVVDVLSNGNLKVRGEKWLVINNGKEYIRLTGIIRPKDIDQNNMISSFKVADARIEFSGTGDQADAQTEGWLTSFFNSSMWPF